MVRTFEALDSCRVEAEVEVLRICWPIAGDEVWGCGSCVYDGDRMPTEDLVEAFLAERLGLEAVDGVRLPPTSESLLTSVYIEVAEELRRTLPGRPSCPPVDWGRIVDILRSPVIGLTSITSCTASCRTLLPRLVRADDGRWMPASMLIGSGPVPLSLRVLELWPKENACKSAKLLILLKTLG